MLTDDQRESYEQLSIPFCLLYGKEDNYEVLAVSDGLCRLLETDRSVLMDPQHSIVSFIAPEDRTLVSGAIENARVYYGQESCVSFHRKDSNQILTISNVAELCSDGSYRINIFFSAIAKCLPALPKNTDSINVENTSSPSLAVRPETLVDRWVIDLSDDRNLSFEKKENRALDIDLNEPYHKTVEWIAKTPHTEENKKKLAALLNPDFLKKQYEEEHTTFSVQYRRDNHNMPYWVNVLIRTYLSHRNGHLECTIDTYDVTEEILNQQLISRFTMLGYEIVGILDVASKKVRFFRMKPKKFGMVYEYYQDYKEAIEGDSVRVIAKEQQAEVNQALSLETVVAALQEHSSYEYAFDLTTADGRHRHKLLQFTYMNEDHDLIFLCRSDVTSQYQSEQIKMEELRKAKLEAEQANDAKSTFLSSVSHDLRTPLNGVIGFTDLALNAKDMETMQAYMEKVRSSSALLLDLVNDTLELSRIESGKAVMECEAVNLYEMAESVITALQPSAEIKSLSVETEIESCRNVTVWTDRLKFQKIFLNLLSNAIKYTPSGGKILAAVKWDPSDPDGSCTMIVKDNGIGIRPEFMPHIFESFTQDHRRETKQILGTGLGLSIVKRNVEMMHGQIHTESVVDHGTTFTVILPLALPDPSAQVTREPLRSTVSLQGKRVLLCEDNEMNTEIAKMMLMNQGMTVDTAANGREALEHFKIAPAHYYDVILMDIHMPIMDGLEATRAIRHMDRPDAKDVPILAMTADAFEEGIRKCMDAGMNDHLMKPINPEVLFQTIGKYISE